MTTVEKKELVKYLADYIETEISRAEPAGGTYDADDYRVWLNEGIDAFESTTEQTVAVKTECSGEFVLVNWPDSQEFLGREGVRLSDESSCFVPLDMLNGL